MNPDKKDIIAIALICLAVFCVYLNSLPNNFVFDDRHMIVDNAYLKSPKHFPGFFRGEITSEPIAKGMYRPLLMLSLAFNYLTSGLKPYGYHILNILLHFLNACFLYFFLKIFLRNLNFNLRLLTTLIFCLHPVNTEAVSYISSRSDLLSSFFVIASLGAYILYRDYSKKQSYPLSLLLYACALLSKETGIVAFGLIAAYEFVFSEKIIKNHKSILARVLPFVLISIAYFILRKYLFGVIAANPRVVLSNRSLSANIFTQSAVSLYYIYLFLFPLNLCIDHNFPVINSLSNSLGLGAVIIIIALVLLALFFKKRITPLLSFSCLWYFISLSPKFYARLNLVAAEHQAYLAFFALYFMLGYLFSKTEKIKQAIRTKALKEIFPRYFFIFILSLFFLLTIIRNFQWRDENALWKATYKINPESGIAKGSLGLSFQNQNLFKEAEAFLKDSADSPAMGNSRATSLLNLATFYALRGELDKGMEILKQNRDYLLRFNKAGFYKTLGFVNMMMGRKEEARSVWQEALKMSAHNAKIKALLGMLYSEQFQDRQKAKQYYKEAISDDPDLVLARLGLALVLENEDSAAAIEQYEAAIKLNPQNFIPYFHLGLIYARSLLSTKAEWYFKKAIQLNPNAAGAHYNLAVYYLSLQEPDYKLALKYFNKAKALGYKVDKEIENLLTSADTPPSH